MNNLKSISAKLSLLLIIAVFVPLIVYGILSIWTSRYFNARVVKDGNINVAKRAAEEIDLYVINRVSILNALLQNLGRFQTPLKEQKMILSNYLLNFPEFKYICILDHRGKEIISVNNSGYEREFKGAAFKRALKGEVYKSEVYLAKDNIPQITIAVPVKILNTIQQVAVTDISLLPMWSLVESIRIGESGYAFVVSGDGTLIAHGRGENKIPVLANNTLRRLKIVKDVLKGGFSTDIYKNIEDKNVIGVAAPIPSLGWGIIIEEPLKEAYASSRNMTVLLTVMIFLCIAAASFFGYSGSRRYILKPLQTLLAATRRVAGGNVEENVSISTGDEFQEVGEGFNRMMTELKVLQEDIKRNERIAFMNKIAAGLVHDLRHPVRNIENCSRLMMKMYDNEECRNTFKKIVTREFFNINKFLDDLMDLSKPVQVVLISVNICRELKGIIEMFREEMENKSIAVKANCPVEPLSVKLDKFLIERVFKNIIRNAIDAMPGGGELIISVKLSNTFSGNSPGNFLDIELRDTGQGIPPDRLKDLFTEFTTTKGTGLGLGLAVTKRIVEAHNGTIRIESTVGSGTSVIVRLPV